MKAVNKIISVIILLIALAFAVVQFILLPETVALQVNFRGEASNTVPKFVAIAIPLAITFYGALNYYIDEKRKKALLWPLLGILLAAVTFFMNINLLV